MSAVLTLRPQSSCLARLDAWPGVQSLLGARRVRLTPLPGESPEALENRVGTALMVLWRDVRSAESFEALYAFAEPAVLQWIRGLLHAGTLHLDPRELLQDTFVNVYRYPTAFREEHSGSFRVWVRTIAGNIVRRARGAERRISFQELPDGFQEPEDERENPFRRAVSIEQESLVQGAWVLFLCLYACAWRELGQRDRRTLHLVEVEGLSYQEAGRILSVGRSNMKMIVFRSRKRIARQMRAVLAAARLRPSVA